MIFNIKFDWYTDGDWSLRLDKVKKYITELDSLVFSEWDYDENDINIGGVYFKFEGKNSLKDVRELIEILMTSLDVSPYKVYALDDLLKMFKNAYKYLVSGKFIKSKSFKSIDGNYEGTELIITVI